MYRQLNYCIVKYELKSCRRSMGGGWAMGGLAIAALLQGQPSCVRFCAPCKCAAMCVGVFGIFYKNGIFTQGFVQRTGFVAGVALEFPSARNR